MIRHKRPDRKNALSMIDSAKRDIKYTLSLDISEESATTILRNIYESFRMLGDALLINKGIKSIDHITPIKELLNLNIKTKRPLNLIDNLRRLRHNINYYGYKPKIEEVKDAISLVKTIFQPIVKQILEELKQNPKI